jgi:hypothetical protein
METAQQTPTPGSLSWRLSSHPITLLTFLCFRICTPAPPIQPPAPTYTHAHAQHTQLTTLTPLQLASSSTSSAYAS